MLDSERDPRGQSPSRGQLGLTSGRPPAPPPAPPMDKAALHNAASGPPMAILAGICAMLTQGLYFKVLGAAEYGLWLLPATFLHLLQLTNNGLSAIIVQQASAPQVRTRETNAYESLVSTSFWLTLIAAAFLSLPVGIGLYLLISSSGMSNEDAQRSIRMIPLAAIVSILFLTNETIAAHLEAQHLLRKVRLTQLITAVSMMTLSALLLWFDFSLWSVPIAHMLSILVGLAVNMQYMKTHLPPLHFGTRVDWKLAMTLVRGASHISLASIFGMLLLPTLKFILVRTSGLTSVSYFEVCYALAFRVKHVADTAVRACLSYFCAQDLSTDQMQKQAKKVLAQISTLTAVVVLPSYAVCIWISKPVLQIWLGQRPALEASSTLQLLFLASSVAAMGTPYYYYLVSRNHISEIVKANAFGAGTTLSCLALVWVIEQGAFAHAEASLITLISVAVTSSMLVKATLLHREQVAS